MVCLKRAIVKLLPKRYSHVFHSSCYQKKRLTTGFIDKWGLFVSFRFSLEEEEAVLVVILIIFMLTGGALAVLAYENFATLTIEIHLTLFGWRAPVLPLGVVLLLAFLLGALLLYVVTVLSAWRDRRQLARLRRRVAELEQANMYPQQYSPSGIIPMPGTQANSPPAWLN
jgi:uncharacterized integral membrane protein